MGVPIGLLLGTGAMTAIALSFPDAFKAWAWRIPFLASLLALATLAGVPDFVFVQWIAPLVSEFPEMLSTLYWARRSDRAPMALMNMVSSNINQWTLLAAMLPIVYSISVGAVTPITSPLPTRTNV